VTVLDLLRPLTSYNAQHRGQEYTSRVRWIDGTADSVTSTVRGSTLYDVALRVDGDALTVFCSCPYFVDQRNICKHVWATAIVADQRGWLKTLPASLRVEVDLEGYDFVDELESEDDLDSAAGRRTDPDAVTPRSAVPRVASDFFIPRQRPPDPPEWSVVLSRVAPEPQERPASVWPGSQLIYVIAAPAGATLTEVPLFVERLDRKKNGDWSKPQPSRLTFEMIPVLPDPDDRWALSLIHASSAFPRTGQGYGYGLTTQPLGPSYLQSSLIDLLLPRLCATGRVRLRHVSGPYAGSAPAEGDLALRWEDAQPWRFELVVTGPSEPAVDAGEDSGRRLATDRQRSAGQPEKDRAFGYQVEAMLTRGEERAHIGDFTLLTDSIAVRNDTVAPFDPSGGLRWATALRQRGPVMVPVESQRALVDALVHSGIEHVQVPEELRWDERTVAPRFRITIGAPQYLGDCAVAAEVEYESMRVPIQSAGRLLIDGGRTVYRRDVEAEHAALATLKRLGVAGLEPHLRQTPTVNNRRVSSLVHALINQGWTVEAEGVRYRVVSAPRLRIRSGIDWFELDAIDDVSALTIDVGDLLKALSAGRRTVMLGDGTVGMLPEDWLARVAPALSIGEADQGHIRFKPSQAALIDALLASQPQVDWDEGFARACEALKRFEGVHAEAPAPTFAGCLRDYQKEALGWMRFLRDFGFGGCLADDMGLGKTVMVLAMLDKRRHDTRSHTPSLIVLPRSLLFNWQTEAARFTPELRVLDFAHADRHSAAAEIARADLVLTTYGTLRRDVVMLKDQAFDYVVLDEAQAIKNANTATAKAARLLRGDHRLALTGTPVENHLGELHSLFDFLNPGLLGKKGVLGQGARGAGEDDYVRRLAKGLRPFFLRRTKEQVAPELPPRTDETLYCELEGEQLKLYEQLREHYRRVLLRLVDSQGLAKSRLQVLTALLRLRQAACHSGLLAPLEGAGRQPSLRPTAATPSSAKFEVLLPRVAELVAEGRKALVFSQFTSLLGLFRERLDAHGIAYQYLDGDTRDRALVVQRFQEDPAFPVFLISLKAGGVGLNLTAAEYVFLLDPWWNPAVEMQAVDRTHRIGQLKPVFAYRLVARGTVEERILELQSRKRELADAILEAGSGGFRALQREDLEQLLS
jgi:superfamily II DNA or RNA helicase